MIVPRRWGAMSPQTGSQLLDAVVGAETKALVVGSTSAPSRGVAPSQAASPSTKANAILPAFVPFFVIAGKNTQKAGEGIAGEKSAPGRVRCSKVRAMAMTGRVMAFLATTDGARARSFYEGTLGLNVTSDDDFALALDANGTMLRVQKVAPFTPHAFTALGWEVADVAAAVAGLAKKGVRFERYDGLGQDAAGIWRSPSGARVAWFRDPDGNVLSLTQL
jgi:catechol 2,3-dioxygenase-like lactoylglutathione lyase family enzyme